ncbi:MAG: signal peptidase I [Acidobacteriota bacterium]|nr:signal peptidase I [Acidobacteriota bacterium]
MESTPLPGGARTYPGGPHSATLDPAMGRQETIAPRRWWVAAPVSLLAPGLAQVYNGQARKGLLIAIGLGGIAALLSLSVLAPLPIWAFGLLAVLYLFLDLFALADGITAAVRSGPRHRLERYNRWPVYLAVLALSLMLQYGWIGLAETRVAGSFRIPSGSMEPTLRIGDDIAVSSWMFRSAPRRGDIVIFRHPENQGLIAIKRVVAVAGDRVAIRGKTLFVNGRPAAEPYVIHSGPLVPGSPQQQFDDMSPRTIPQGTLFVLGDNRDSSYDSRFWGPLPAANVLGGRRIRVYWSRDPATATVRWDRIGRLLG